jgi:hypothetical protein
MRKEALITVFLVILLVSCAPVSVPAPTYPPQSTATSTPQPTVTFTPQPTATFMPEPTATFTPEPTPIPTPTRCPDYFQSINPAIVVKHSPSSTHYPAAETGGVRSIILTKATNCPISNFENISLTIYINGNETISGETLYRQIQENGIVRLDYTAYEFPDSPNLEITVQDEAGQEIFTGEVLNIAQTGIFRIPQFRNVRTGTTNPEILEKYEIRVYHVDSIVLPNEVISSSFNIGNVLDVDDQCSKPDGIHPEFIHMNAIDYGKCEWGPGSTNYEIVYTGAYPMKVRDVVDTRNDTSVTIEFDFELVSSPPLFVIENKNGKLTKFYLRLQYNHLTEVFVKRGDAIQSGTVIGLIGKSEFRTELEEARLLSREPNGPAIPYNHGELPFVPFRLTLSESEGEWIEFMINRFNE